MHWYLHRVLDAGYRKDRRFSRVVAGPDDPIHRASRREAKYDIPGALPGRDRNHLLPERSFPVIEVLIDETRGLVELGEGDSLVLVLHPRCDQHSDEETLEQKHENRD